MMDGRKRKHASERHEKMPFHKTGFSIWLNVAARDSHKNHIYQRSPLPGALGAYAANSRSLRYNVKANFWDPLDQASRGGTQIVRIEALPDEMGRRVSAF